MSPTLADLTSPRALDGTRSAPRPGLLQGALPHTFSWRTGGGCAAPDALLHLDRCLRPHGRAGQSVRQSPLGLLRWTPDSRPLSRGQDLGSGEGMAELGAAGWSHLTAGRVLLVVALIKRCLRITQRIWSHCLSVKLIRVAGRAVCSRENLPEAETENEGWVLSGDDSPRAFGVPACLVSRGTARLYSGLSFRNAV